MAEKKRRKKFLMSNTENVSSTIQMDISIETLDQIILYLFTSWENNNQISRKSISQIHELFNMIDKRPYELDETMISRIYFINRITSLELNENIYTEDLLLTKCLEGNHKEEIKESIIPFIRENGPLNADEAKFINKYVSDRLQFSYLYKFKPILESKFEDLVLGRFTNMSDINSDIERIILRLNSEIRKAKLDDESNNDFNFSDVNFEDNLSEIVTEIKKPTNYLKAGIKKLNQMLSGGFQSGRLYLFMGITGGFKSGILLNILYWIKKYNLNYQTNDPEKIPTVLYITQENSMMETIERLWGIGCSDKDIKECSKKKIIRGFQNSLLRNEEENINIHIMYKPNKSISTDDLYNIYDDLSDNGEEVICVIHDYTKRIRPAMINGELRIDLGNIVDEETVFAKTKNIPFITAAQLNRKAMEIIEESIQSGKRNAIDKLGASNVGESWAMLENADWVGLINQEELIDENNPDIVKKFLSVKQLKIRGKKPTVFNSFVQPFYENNGIKLIDDEGMEKSMSVESVEILSTGKIPIDKSGFTGGSKKKKNSTTISRRETSKKIAKINEEIDEDLKDFE